MKYFLLDGGGNFLPLFGELFAFMVLAILLEAFVMFQYKLNRFGKCLSQSVIVNIVSLVAGILIGYLISSIGGEKISLVLPFIIMFVATVLIEGGLLIWMNRQQAKKKIWQATLVMNIASYAILLMFLLAYR